MTNLMIELKNDSRLKAAVERAKTHHPKVRVTGNRSYQVQGSNKSDWYEVRFAVINHRRLASCTCRGAERGLICYHMAAAAAVNIGLRRLELQAAPIIHSQAA